MRKVINWIFKNMFGFILGAIIFTVVGVIAATSFSSSQVTYTGNSQSTVEGALNNLYTRANTWIEPDFIDFATLTSPTTKTMLASSKGVCIIRNNRINCFKPNNYNIEKDNIQQVFSDVSCNVDSSYVYCVAPDFLCYVDSNGNVTCQNQSDNSYCSANSDGSVDCSPVNEILPIDPNTFQTNTAKTVYASSKGICIKINNKLNCFKVNNYDYEKDHIKQVYPNPSVSCASSSNGVHCTASYLACVVQNNGSVSCTDTSDSSYCGVSFDGSVTCN